MIEAEIDRQFESYESPAIVRNGRLLQPMFRSRKVPSAVARFAQFRPKPVSKKTTQTKIKLPYIGREVERDDQITVKSQVKRVISDTGELGDEFSLRGNLIATPVSPRVLAAIYSECFRTKASRLGPSSLRRYSSIVSDFYDKRGEPSPSYTVKLGNVGLYGNLHGEGKKFVGAEILPEDDGLEVLSESADFVSKLIPDNKMDDFGYYVEEMNPHVCVGHSYDLGAAVEARDELIGSGVITGSKIKLGPMDINSTFFVLNTETPNSVHLG